MPANLDNRLFICKVNTYWGFGQDYNTPKQRLSSDNFCAVKPLCRPNAFVPLFHEGGILVLVLLALFLWLLGSSRLSGVRDPAGIRRLFDSLLDSGPLA